ncbi:GNAT family N-acetyltransferase [Streptomyces longwoodensis]|uniref:GNAT family N-acetyltransferase n=1 Tax=Streptomyces longwoodensis TaxID=68231 RepID=UPI0033F1B698
MSRPPHITPTGPQGLEQAIALHQRCSPHTLWSRYHRAMPDPRSYLPALLGRPGSVHLAAWDSAGRTVALGHLMPDGLAAEVALLVEDTWQNQGLGTRLLHALGRHAIGTRWITVHGLVLPGDERIAAVLRHVSVPVHSQDEDGAIRLWARTADLAALTPATTVASGGDPGRPPPTGTSHVRRHTRPPTRCRKP